MKSIDASAGAGFISISFGGGFLANNPQPERHRITAKINHVRILPGMQAPHYELTHRQRPGAAASFPGGFAPDKEFTQPLVKILPFELWQRRTGGIHGSGKRQQIDTGKRTYEFRHITALGR